jgi:hypothetical protein
MVPVQIQKVLDSHLQKLLYSTLPNFVVKTSRLSSCFQFNSVCWAPRRVASARPWSFIIFPILVAFGGLRPSWFRNRGRFCLGTAGRKIGNLGQQVVDVGGTNCLWARGTRVCENQMKDQGKGFESRAAKSGARALVRAQKVVVCVEQPRVVC